MRLRPAHRPTHFRQRASRVARLSFPLVSPKPSAGLGSRVICSGIPTPGFPKEGPTLILFLFFSRVWRISEWVLRASARSDPTPPPPAAAAAAAAGWPPARPPPLPTPGVKAPALGFDSALSIFFHGASEERQPRQISPRVAKANFKNVTFKKKVRGRPKEDAECADRGSGLNQTKTPPDSDEKAHAPSPHSPKATHSGGDE